MNNPDDEHVENGVDPELKSLAMPPRRFLGARVAPVTEQNHESQPPIDQFRMMRWEKITIVALVALVIIAAAALATISVRGHLHVDKSLDGEETGPVPTYFTGLTVTDLTKLCPEGATGFDPSKIPSNIFQRQGDYGAMVAAEVMDGADLDPYSCSPQNLAVLWLAAHPPEHLLHESLARRYILTTLYFSLKGWLWRRDGNWLQDVDECTWEGVACNENGHVTSLSLNHNNLSGTIPEDLRHLSLLQALDFSQNSVTGTIPMGLVTLPQLASLELSVNNFSGTVPMALFEQSQLRILDLAHFGGTLETISTEIGRLSSLERLLAPDIGIGGTLPTEIGLCQSLRFLDLSHNQLEGDIPTQLGHLGKLQTLYLTGNHFQEVPDEVCFMTRSGKLMAFDMKARCIRRRET